MNNKIMLVTLLAFLLSACAGKRVNLNSDSVQNIPLSKLQHWQLNARVAIKTPQDALTASLNWQNNNKEFDFLLSGAFGVTYAHLIQKRDSASLKIPDSDKLYHNNAEQLLNQTLGWDFPIKALSYWVKGLPSGQPGERVHHNKQGQLIQINLNQWQIVFSKYKRYQGILLPKMIKATHPDLSLKIVAKKWQFFE
jgi:outer membrane lipoprotein LolB